MLYEVITLNLGIQESITNELNRLKKMKFKSAILKVFGDKVDISNKKHRNNFV